MQQEYVNSFHHNYLKVKMKQDYNKKLRYQYQVLSAKRLEGLLPVSLHINNGENSLYYEISEKQSLSKWFRKKKISREWMKQFCAGLKTALWSMEQYLLDERNLLLHPDFIFVDMETEIPFFLYCPYNIEEEPFSPEEFLIFLTEHIEEKEQKELEKAYTIFSKWENAQEAFTAESFLLLWEKDETQEEETILQEEETGEQYVYEKAEEAEDCGKSGFKRRELAEFLFGFRKNRKAAEYQPGLAMESWTYGSEAFAEERKLYGNGRQNRRVISLNKLPLTFGKSAELSEVVLAEASVSGMHARLTEENGEIYLEDLNAANGTFKNGVRLQPYEKVELLQEDEVRFGNLYFTYR